MVSVAFNGEVVWEDIKSIVGRGIAILRGLIKYVGQEYSMNSIISP